MLARKHCWELAPDKQKEDEMNQYRQGDIFLREVNDQNEIIDLINCKQSIEGDEIKNYVILALGEATGHKHKVSNKNAILMKVPNSNKFFLLITKDSDLTHEEHNTIRLPIGNYEVVRQREYRPSGIVNVAD